MIETARKTAGVVVVALLALPSSRVLAVEYLTADQPAPATVEEDSGPLEEGLEPPAPEAAPEPLLTPPPGVPREMQLLLHPRVYYFDRDNDPRPDNVALAYGGWLTYHSGWWRDRFAVNASLYTTQHAYGPQHKDGTLLLAPGQEGFTVLGEANLAVRFAESTTATLYRQTLDLPYINKNDSRMIPNSFEAYGLRHLGSRLGLTAGHVTRMKPRDGSQFIPMSEAAGIPDSDEPLTYAGVRYRITDEIDIGAINLYSWNLFNTLYVEGNAVWRLSPSAAIRLGAQYTDQQSVGDALGGRFDTTVFGGRISTGWRGAILTAAFSMTADEVGIRSPYGGYPGYLSLMLSDFNRAGEDAWLVGASYDFSTIGIRGLSGFVNYARGYTPNRGARASADQQELDLTLDYRVPFPPLEGLWLRARAAWLDQDDDGVNANDARDYRVILNYEIPFL